MNALYLSTNQPIEQIKIITMGWINNLLANRKEKEQISKLVALAEADQSLDQSDIKILQEEMTFISWNQHHNGSLEKYRNNLPKAAKEKFETVFFLVNFLMDNGALSDSKENLTKKLVQQMELSSEKAAELTGFLKLNIRNGLSKADSYSRLGYLLEPSKYA